MTLFMDLWLDELQNLIWFNSLFQICERIFIGELQWNIHLNSAKHRNVINKKKRLLNEQQQNDSRPVKKRSA